MPKKEPGTQTASSQPPANQPTAESTEGQRIEIQHLVDAVGDAAKRTRAATIALLVMSVLVLSGLVNSLQSSWTLDPNQANSWLVG